MTGAQQWKPERGIFAYSLEKMFKQRLYGNVRLKYVILKWRAE